MSQELRHKAFNSAVLRRFRDIFSKRDLDLLPGKAYCCIFITKAARLCCRLDITNVFSKASSVLAILDSVSAVVQLVICLRRGWLASFLPSSEKHRPAVRREAT